MWFDCPHGLGPLHLIFDLIWLLALAPIIYLRRFWWWIRRKKKRMKERELDDTPR